MDGAERHAYLASRDNEVRTIGPWMELKAIHIWPVAMQCNAMQPATGTDKR